MTAPLLIEIGCEEIPARMISGAAEDLGRRVAEILDQARLPHGGVQVWGGSRRLAVRIDDVTGRQEDRREQMLGPPVKVAFAEDGSLAPAARGFAKKQGIDPEVLERIETDRGVYVGFEKDTPGQSVGEVLARQLPESVGQMWFPKNMRWGVGKHRWVRPVHWLLALHGDELLPVELFDCVATKQSVGHRFLSTGPVVVDHADSYADVLERAHVVTDPAERRRRLEEGLTKAAAAAGGEVRHDPALLDEVADLAEWPGVVAGSFHADYLELPVELLVTTLRHHQKCFSVQDAEGVLLPAFLAIANTTADPAGHIRRGNEWVVGGRLEDARFFWREDRKRTLASRYEELARVVFHARCGSYADKAERSRVIARELCERLGLDDAAASGAAEAARLAKVDLVTNLVGEFPELQGVVGGVLLRAEGAEEPLAQAVYEHYRPGGPEDPLPQSRLGAVLSVADKLDTVAELIRAKEKATGSRDPFGMRRAANGIFRVVVGHEWPLSIGDLAAMGRSEGPLEEYLLDRLSSHLREHEFTSNEIQAVFRPQVAGDEHLAWPLGDILARLQAIKGVRGREDFRRLVKLTERVDTILTKNAKRVSAHCGAAESGYDEIEEAAVGLDRRVQELGPRMETSATEKDYVAIVDRLAEFIEPVDHFFEKVLVINDEDPDATAHRYQLLGRLNQLLTRYFDIRELSGEAERRT